MALASDALRPLGKGPGLRAVIATVRVIGSRTICALCWTLAVARPRLSYDLTFPEVFYPNGVPYGRHGFHAVVGNPPWDRMLPADKEFFASFDFAILDAPTKRERDAIQNRLTKDAATKDAYLEYIEGFRGAERAVDTLFTHQVAVVNGEKTIGKQDLFRLFMERMSNLAISAGLIGVVVPSAFHANEGATAVRQLYLNKMALRCCYSFENRRALFEIHRSFKFALIVSVAGSTTTKFNLRVLFA